MRATKLKRRRFVAGTAAASAALVAAPFVRGAYAAGQVSVFFWDHWVPAGNAEMKKQVAAWSEKNKVEVKADFITSQGQQTLLTINAEAQARRGHDIITIANWNVRDHADKLENVDDVVGRLIAKNGEANAVAHYLGKEKGKWVAVPSSWGTQNKGPAGRISLMKEYAGLDLVKMYPAADVPETDEAKAWTNEAMLKAAEACFKAGKPFGIGLGTTADNVDTAGSLFASFGAELVDAKGAIQIKSAAVRQALEYCQKLVKFLPADAQSWDDSSNNRALISGNASFIYNPPSAWAVAVRDAPAVAADTWQRLDPWQRRLTRFVVTKTYAPVGAGGSSDRPALARTVHTLGRDDWNEAIVEPVQGVADRLLGTTEPFVRRAFEKCLVTDPLGLKLVAPTGI